MRKNSARSMLRSWAEAGSVGLCIALTAMLLQALLGREDWTVRLLALIGASLVVCLVQFAISSWRFQGEESERPRETEDEGNHINLF